MNTTIAHCYELYVFISVAYCWFWDTKTMLLSHNYNQYWICCHFTIALLWYICWLTFCTFACKPFQIQDKTLIALVYFCFPTVNQDLIVLTLGIVSERKPSELKLHTSRKTISTTAYNKEAYWLSCCKFCIYTQPVNSKFITWHKKNSMI